MDEALGNLAESAEEAADEQRLVAKKARSMRRQRRLGRTWGSILDHSGDPSIFALLATSLRRLSSASKTFRSTVAVTLAGEGAPLRQIAARFGVSHQRVSAILKRR